MGLHVNRGGDVRIGNVADTTVKATKTAHGMVDMGAALRDATRAMDAFAKAGQAIYNAVGAYYNKKEVMINAQASAVAAKGQYLSDCKSGKKKYDETTAKAYDVKIKSYDHWHKYEESDKERGLRTELQRQPTMEKVKEDTPGVIYDYTQSGGGGMIA